MWNDSENCVTPSSWSFKIPGDDCPAPSTMRNTCFESPDPVKSGAVAKHRRRSLMEQSDTYRTHTLDCSRVANSVVSSANSEKYVAASTSAALHCWITFDTDVINAFWDNGEIYGNSSLRTENSVFLAPESPFYLLYVIFSLLQFFRWMAQVAQWQIRLCIYLGYLFNLFKTSKYVRVTWRE